ncbi:hypothetical protein MRX96_007159 [Rhipicephalus microplus]
MAVKAPDKLYFNRGRGSSDLGNILSNPFYPMLHVAMVVLGNRASSGVYAASTTLGGVVHDAGGHLSKLGECGIKYPRFPRAIDRHIILLTVTQSHVPHCMATKAPDKLYLTHERGRSDLGNILSNPFCPMVHVAMVVLGNRASSGVYAASTTLVGVVHDAGGHLSTLGECGNKDPRFARAIDRHITL